MILYILRGAFILLVASVSMLYVLDYQQNQGADFLQVTLMVSLTLGVGTTVILLDIFLRHKKLSSLAGIFLGLLAGLVTAYALSFVVDLIGMLFVPDASPEYPELQKDRDAFLNLLQGIKVIIGLLTCYAGISLVLQTKDDFRFSIPYVEFSRQVRGNRPIVLDSSVLIDGRIAEIVDTQIIQSMLVVPKFVLNEMQLIADASDKLRRQRGRRGLETVSKLQENPNIEVVINEMEVDGPTVDQKLLSLAQQLQGQVMTNDFNLNKIAGLRGIEVINLNELAKALRPVALPGERMRIRIVKPGESGGQGVGYLEDGTMVVVEGARRMMGQEIDVTVTSTLQTSAGRMIFGKYDPQEGHEERGEGSPRHKPVAAEEEGEREPAAAGEGHGPQ